MSRCRRPPSHPLFKFSIPWGRDFTLLFRVYYPSLIFEPVFFSLFSSKSSNSFFEPFDFVFREILVSASLLACSQLSNFLYHAHSRTLCSCKMCIDPLGDHVLSCNSPEKSSPENIARFWPQKSVLLPALFLINEERTVVVRIVQLGGSSVEEEKGVAFHTA